MQTFMQIFKPKVMEIRQRYSELQFTLQRTRFRQMDILNSTNRQVSIKKTLLKQYEHKICSGRKKGLRFLTVKLVR